MSDTLVIQWGRLGDVVQTRVLLHRLKYTNPQNKIVFCVNSRYSDVAALFPEADEVWPINLVKLFALSRYSANHSEAVEYIRNMFEAMQNRRIDSAIVLSHSGAAALLAKQCASRVVGYEWKDGKLVEPALISEIHAATRQGIPAPVHICDAWTFLANLSCFNEQPHAIRNHAENNVSNRKRIGIIADTGDVKRTPSIDWLKKMCLNFLKSDDFEIIVTGGKAATDSISELSTKSQNLRDLRGKTTILELVNELQRMNCVIGPDTGSLHLASILGCSTIGLYNGGALAVQTGPYSAKSVVIQNPSWSVGLADQILAILQLKKENAENVWYPHFDKYGLLYKPENCSENLTKQFNIQRENLLSKLEETLDIIIPEHGGRHYTEDLLKDIEQSGVTDYLNIIVISSGDTAHIPLESRSLRIRHIVSKAPLSFADACNRGANAGSSSWLLFLNNDTRIERGSLKTLWEGRQSRAIQTPLIKYPDGLLQNGGVVIDEWGIHESFHAELKFNLHSARKTGAVSAVAMLMSRCDFEKLDGFDTAYINGYEDLDLCLRAAKLGIEVSVNSAAEVTHFRGSSVGRFDNETINSELFKSRHNLKFSKKPAQAPPTIDASKILIISDEQENTAGALTRWIWPLENLGLEKKADFNWLNAREESKESLEYLFASAEHVIVFRNIQSAFLQQAIRQYKKNYGFQLIVDSDDIIIGRFPQNSNRMTVRRSMEIQFHELLDCADLITVSTENIERILYSNWSNIQVLPTVPHPQWIRTENNQINREHFNLGFFGSQAHLIDLGEILPALEIILDRFPHVRFYWWGCRPGNLAYHPQVRQGGPFVKDYKTHLIRMRSFGIDGMIVPLLDSEANNCRTAIKFIEYSLSGIPAVYSDVVPYNLCVRNRITGLLSDNCTDAWVEALTNIVQNNEGRKLMSHAAFNEQSRQACDPARLRPYKNLFSGVQRRNQNNLLEVVQ